MFSLFFAGLQQDVKLMMFAPILSAVFRLIFIEVYGPEKSPWGHMRKWYHCFRYGFWWGMDWHAYVFLYSMVLVSLPGAFFPAYFAVGDTVRTVGVMLYAFVLYTAFVGRMIFYYHFHDVFNQTLLLGKNADKQNFADIFFHQNHGGWILLSYVPVMALFYGMVQALLGLPSFPYPALLADASSAVRYAGNTVIFVAAIVFFYFLRYGGSLQHKDKPEWDEIPPVVKEDVFFAKATWDDLVRLEFVRAVPAKKLLTHTDEQALPVMEAVAPNVVWQEERTPLAAFVRTAKGAKIAPPSHIFYILGESYYQAPLDAPFAALHIMDRGKAFFQDAHTFSLPTTLSAGLISQPSLVSLLSGFYDANLEFNETEAFWSPWRSDAWAISLPQQLKKLGYRSVFWYGGPLNWGSLLHFLPAIGFDAAMDGFACNPGAPRTWLGTYDDVFLSDAVRRIPLMDDGTPVLHFLYTTSIHGPFTIPAQKYGYDAARIMPEVPTHLQRNRKQQKAFGCYWYSDRAIMDFVQRMQEQYPDALFIITGDHASLNIPYDVGLVPRKEPTLREMHSTCFGIHHRDLSQAWFAGNTIGGHMNIFPTLMELLAPAGHRYLSIAKPLTEPVDHVVTPQHWLTREEIGRYEDRIAQANCVTAEALPMKQETVRFEEERNGWLELSGWLARHPACLLKQG